MKNLFYSVILVTIVFYQCKKSEVENVSPSYSKTSNQLAGDVQSEKLEEDTSGGKSDKKEERKQSKEDNAIETPINPFTIASNSRLLEYKVYLDYKVSNLKEARIKIVDIIKRDSFIKQSNTNTNYEDKENMSTDIYVPVDKLYDTLIELDKLGSLFSEQITTEDWTEHNEQQKIKIEREDIRTRRRANASTKGSPDNWNYKDREELLERSENSMDEAKFESWKIKDRVKWAKLSLHITGREIKTPIQIPNYRNAVISSFNFLLELSYYIVWCIPAFILLFIVFKIYRRIKSDD